MTKLTKDIAYQELADFFQDKPFILFGTGTSCAISTEFGMGALLTHLKKAIKPTEENQKQQWQNVLTQLANNEDFEKSMDQISDDALIKSIIEQTAIKVQTVNSQYEYPILSGQTTWPASRLIKRIFDARRPAESIHIATPNYDLLAEYALEYLKIPYINGFTNGFCGQLDWQRSQLQVSERKTKRIGNKSQIIIEPIKHIRLYKPHGSLNTFKFNNAIVQCDSWIQNPPNTIERFMITPGSSKYKRLHDDSKGLDTYREAVTQHNSFLFLGFGFNDSHLVNDIFKDKIQNSQAPALVITRDHNEHIQNWLDKCPNMWLVCKHQDNESTRIYNHKYDDWLYLANEEIWQFDNFATQILGA